LGGKGVAEVEECKESRSEQFNREEKFRKFGGQLGAYTGGRGDPGISSEAAALQE